MPGPVHISDDEAKLLGLHDDPHAGKDHISDEEAKAVGLTPDAKADQPKALPGTPVHVPEFSEVHPILNAVSKGAGILNDIGHGASMGLDTIAVPAANTAYDMGANLINNGKPASVVDTYIRNKAKYQKDQEELNSGLSPTVRNLSVGTGVAAQAVPAAGMSLAQMAGVAAYNNLVNGKAAQSPGEGNPMQPIYDAGGGQGMEDAYNQLKGGHYVAGALTAAGTPLGVGAVGLGANAIGNAVKGVGRAMTDSELVNSYVQKKLLEGRQGVINEGEAGIKDVAGPIEAQKYKDQQLIALRKLAPLPDSAEKRAAIDSVMNREPSGPVPTPTYNPNGFVSNATKAARQSQATGQAINDSNIILNNPERFSAEEADAARKNTALGPDRIKGAPNPAKTGGRAVREASGDKTQFVRDEDTFRQQGGTDEELNQSRPGNQTTTDYSILSGPPTKTAKGASMYEARGDLDQPSMATRSENPNRGPSSSSQDWQPGQTVYSSPAEGVPRTPKETVSQYIDYLMAKRQGNADWVGAGDHISRDSSGFASRAGQGFIGGYKNPGLLGYGGPIGKLASGVMSGAESAFSFPSNLNQAESFGGLYEALQGAGSGEGTLGGMLRNVPTDQAKASLFGRARAMTPTVGGKDDKNQP